MNESLNPKSIPLHELERRIRENPEYQHLFQEEHRKRKLQRALIAKLQETKEQAYSLQQEAENDRYIDDRFYRFYRNSTKVYDIQILTTHIVDYMQSLIDDFQLTNFHPHFVTIIQEGTGHVPASQEDVYIQDTRAILEAFFHAKSALGSLIRYGIELPSEKRERATGWFSILTIYQLR